MHGLKRITLAGSAAAALLCIPITPAVAAGPLLLLPVLGHAVAAMARLATLPLIAASAQSPAPYAQRPLYNAAAPNYYAPPGYIASPRVSYAPPVAYHAAPYPYYRATQLYPWPRRDYAPRLSPSLRNAAAPAPASRALAEDLRAPPRWSCAIASCKSQPSCF